MKKLKHILVDQSGALAISFMVLAALSIGLLLQTTDFFRQFQKSLKSTQASSNIEGMITEVMRFLNNPSHCAATFYGHRLGTNQIFEPDPDNPTDLVLNMATSDGTIVEYTGITGGDTRLTSIRTLDPTAVPQNLIDRFNLPSLPGSNGWTVLLELIFQKTDNTSSIVGGNVITRYIPLTLNNFVHLADLMADEDRLQELVDSCVDPDDVNRRHNVITNIESITVKDYSTNPPEDKVMLVGKCYSAALTQIVNFCGN